MTGIQCLACLCTLIITQTTYVCSGTQFLERNEGESVVFPCVVEQGTRSAFGVYLKRSWLRPSEMLYVHTEDEFHMANDDDKNRTSISGHPSSHTVNVTISQLRGSDTDRYYCEFVVENPVSADERLHGKTDFFLLVRAGDKCGCSSYSTLLYALSSAVAVLFLLLLGFVVIYRSKSRRSVKSHPQAPIYEEMTGVQTANRKLAPGLMEDMESSEYRNCIVKKSCPENHYESPSGALFPRRQSVK